VDHPDLKVNDSTGNINERDPRIAGTAAGRRPTCGSTSAPASRTSTARPPSPPAARPVAMKRVTDNLGDRSQ